MNKDELIKKTMSEVGRRGGKTTSQRHGKAHYQKLAEHMNTVRRARKQEDFNQVLTNADILNTIMQRYRENYLEYIKVFTPHAFLEIPFPSQDEKLALAKKYRQAMQETKVKLFNFIEEIEKDLPSYDNNSLETPNNNKPQI